MSAIVLDAGAFVAVDRGDRAMVARLRAAEHAGFEVRTTGIVLTQVWRDPAGRQANLARLLEAVDVKPVDERLGSAAGVLLGAAGATEAVGVSVVAAAATRDRIATSDAGDIAALVAASGRPIHVAPC